MGPEGHREALNEAILLVQAQLQTAARGERLPGPIAEPPEASALAQVGALFGLSAFELQVVVMCAACELQPGFGALCGKVIGNEAATSPSFAAALAALDGAHWDALLPEAPLRALHIVELGPGPTLSERPLSIAEPVLHALLGLPTLDVRLTRRLRPLSTLAQVPASHARCLPRLVGAWSAGHGVRVHLQAGHKSEGEALVARACRELGARCYLLPAAEVPLDAAEREELAALWDRDARLTDAVLIVDLEGVEPARAHAVDHFLHAIQGPMVALSREPLAEARGPWLRLRLAPPSWTERRLLWSTALEGTEGLSEEALDELVARFELDPAGVEQVVGALAMEDSEAPPAEVLWQAARAAARPAMADLAQRIEPRPGTWERLVLPPPQRRQLEALIAQVRHKALVHHRWGFSGQGTGGAGTSAVFSGPSGTGKTMAALAIAGALDLDLYRIDLSSVVSKYIGETEKNLRRVFDAAEAGGSVLLFDEADALFGKRTDVKDSHDRHANIEVSYLLQRMEAYGGLAILTTNFRKAIDEAFLRRLQFVVEFPFPDPPERARIWAGILPADVPTRGLKPERLAQLAMTGGNIQSIARNAAYLAAEAGGPVTMGEVLEAARMEADKLGRSLNPAEIRGWRTAPGKGTA